MNLFNISIDSVSIGVGLIGLILLIASLNMEYSYSIFDLSLLSGRSAVGYYFIACIRSVTTLVTCSSSSYIGNINVNI